MSAVASLALAEIELDESLQPRCRGLDERHLQALMDSAESWPPIVVVREGDLVVVIDGFHRIEAARRLQLSVIAASFAEPPADGDLFRVAFELNAAHGRPLDLRDRKSYARMLLQAHPDYSDR